MTCLSEELPEEVPIGRNRFTENHQAL